jgi:hypothetical protein
MFASRLVSLLLLTASIAATSACDSERIRALNDHEIAKLVQVVNDREIAMAALVLDHATATEELKAYARETVAEHTALSATLATELTGELSPAESKDSRDLEALADETTRQIQAVDEAEFSKQYTRACVQSHDLGLDAVNAILNPPPHRAGHVYSSGVTVEALRPLHPTLEHAFVRMKGLFEEHDRECRALYAVLSPGEDIPRPR